LVLGLLNAPLALAGIPTAPLPSTGATEAYTEATQVTQPSALQKALPQAAPTGPAAIQVTGLSPVLAANQADPKAVESAGPVQPATEATPSDASSTASASLLAKGATPALVQVLPDQAAAGPKAEPIQPQPTTQIQAVLTEPGVHAKAAAKAEPTRPPSDSPDPEALPMTAQGTKTTNAPSNPLVPPPGTLKVLANPATPSDQEAVATFGRTVAAANPAAVDTPATLETLGVKVGPATPPPMPASPDGSALAALSSHARLAEPAPEAAPVPLAPASQPSAPVLQVEGGVRWMLKGGVQEAQLQLHPDSLGQVTIHLRVEGGEVHARLWVTEPGSVQAVQEGRPHLEQSLKEQGLQLGSFDLQQGQRPFQEAPATPSFRDRPAPEPVLARQEAPVSVPVSILNPHHVELYA
jgi:flagellar hook-length control protein FliK